MSYISELRQAVGHRPLVLVGTVLILQRDGEVLFLQRSDNLLWCTPGGMVDPGECVEDAIRRELREETGLSVSDLCLIDVASGPDQHYVYPNGDEVHNVTIVYSGQTVPAEACELDGESLVARWYPAVEAEFPPLSPPTAALFRRPQVRRALGLSPQGVGVA
jgi:8-oxo-dGTP pyrophosphatase MutT (NUDIX family)